jgi:L,D-transpeptidase ErfK/SrfK
VRYFLFAFIIFLVPGIVSASGVFRLQGYGPAVIGYRDSHVIRKGESLVELARDYDLGYNEITEANPGIDPWVPREGTVIVIPTEWIIPPFGHEGITINLAELRLYYIFTIEEGLFVRTFPIGIGRQGWNTPTGEYRITLKKQHPVWKVPEKIRLERPELPEFVKPGPDNPLGDYWLQLSISGYGIHGTNKPFGIGRRVSHGCIRMYPEDIAVLFRYVRPGTKVIIVNMPVKSATIDGKTFIEVHRDDQPVSELLDNLMKNPSGKRLLKSADKDQIMKAITESTGLPLRLQTNPTSSASVQTP